ncbi:Fanconi anemia group D2 protein homolog [Amphibalanus amphitrite]|nr:Fanconi anemia group D2 protein homolog [Amphibalanus amphitrite]
MFAALVEAIRGVVSAGGSERGRLDRWAAALRVFNQMVGCLRVFSSRSAVGVCLKHSRRLVDLFVRHAIPMLELMLKHQRDEVLTILKNFQLSARYLHHVCNHSKSLKDASLMNHVPYLKKGLESFVFRVKAMLALNGCSDAFWMGNLKNRDLRGEEIFSQRSEPDDSTEAAESEGEGAADSDLDLDAADERSSPSPASPGRAADGEEKPESEISDAY